MAETIGKALRQLGKQRQVLCVTHLPQVAASGNDQWSVLRSGVKVKLLHLDRGARIAELARMLGGAESTARKQRRARLLGRSAMTEGSEPRSRLTEHTLSAESPGAGQNRTVRLAADKLAIRAVGAVLLGAVRVQGKRMPV